MLKMNHFQKEYVTDKRRPGGRLLPLAVIFVLLFASVFLAGCGDNGDTGSTDQQQTVSTGSSETSASDKAEETKKKDKENSQKTAKSEEKNSKKKDAGRNSDTKSGSKSSASSGKSKVKTSGSDSNTKASSGNDTSSDKNKSSREDSDKKKKTAKYCYFTVTCHRLTEIKDELPEGLQKLVPSSGVIVRRTKVKLKSGDDAFEITKRVLRAKKVHMSYQGTTQYGTAYVEAINNIYEKDVNSRSGWIYKVNGNAPGVGCSAYPIKKNDVIEWAYTCDLGEDL